MQEVNTLIRQLRKQKGFTQQDLAALVGIDRATLSKIETGASVPNTSTIRLLLEKLGHGAANLETLLLTPAEALWERERAAMEHHISRAEYDIALSLVEAAEANPEIEKTPVVQHVLLFMRGNMFLHTGQPGPAQQLLTQALTHTIPTFDVAHIDQYYLTSWETSTIMMLSSAYATGGDVEKALAVITALKDNFDKNCLDKNLWGRVYPLIIYQLTRNLCLLNRHAEALAYCDAGRKAATAGHTVHLPYIALNEAYCHAGLGNMEESRALFTQVYHTFLLYQFTAVAAAVQRDAKKYADLEL